MKRIKDLADVKIGDITGALRHHAYFTASKSRMEAIKKDADFITKNGIAEYINREYPDVNYKNIIINGIDGKPYLADGNRHCVSMVIADKDITIGRLLECNSRLIRYWENGFELYGDIRYQPYATYIPIDVDVSLIPDARQRIDDKGDRIYSIPSDIAYDSELFAQEDRGRQIYITAHAVETELVYGSCEPDVRKAGDLPKVLGCCGRLYEQISKLNVKYGFTTPGSGYDHTLIWFIAERVRLMPIANEELAEHMRGLPNKELAELIFDSIDNWVRHENNP